MIIYELYLFVFVLYISVTFAVRRGSYLPNLKFT